MKETVIKKVAKVTKEVQRVLSPKSGLAKD
jgi:hypothetical protein